MRPLLITTALGLNWGRNLATTVFAFLSRANHYRQYYMYAYGGHGQCHYLGSYHQIYHHEILGKVFAQINWNFKRWIRGTLLSVSML